MNKERFRDAVITIIVGAIIAFITTFLEGALEYLKGTENNIVGALSGSIAYAVRHIQ